MKTIKMKDSGIEWVGEIPEDWALIRLKDICISKKEIAGEHSNEFERLALTLNGVIKRPKYDSEGLQPKEFDGYQIVYKNDFIFKMIDLQNISTSRVGLSPYTGLVSPAYIRFSPRKEGQFNKFVYYFLMSMYYNCVYNSLGGNGVRSALNATDMGQFLIPFPNIKTQIKIVDYIGTQLKNIDKLIANQQGQIEKLKEYKQAIITQAVTKGLNPSAPMKDSGVEWIGNIASNFQVYKIGSLFACRNEKVSDTEYPPLSVSKGGIVPQIGTVAKSDAIDNRKKVLVSDFVINSRSDRKQSCGLSKLNGSVSLINIVLKILRWDILSSDYTHYLLKNYCFAEEFYRWGHGIVADLWTTSWEEMKNISIPVPSIFEQQQIADYLDKKCSEIDKLISIKQAKIEKLNEYKKSLIYEYVTGKKEVV